jgi:hypothetical protein
MTFTFAKLDKEYRNDILNVIGIIYDVVLHYFIQNSAKQFVDKLNQSIYFNHDELIQMCVDILKKKQEQKQIRHFHLDPEEVITKLYYCIFGEKGQQINDFIYAKKGKGWCERYFPPTDHEMYTFIVDKITHETKIQFYNPIKV